MVGSSSNILFLCLLIASTRAFQCDSGLDVYEESEEFFKNTTEADNSTQLTKITPSGVYYCETMIEINSTKYYPYFYADRIMSSSSDCESVKRIVRPRTLRNIRDDVFTFANEHSFKVEIEVCLTSNSECNVDFFGAFTACRQRYFTMMFRVLNKLTGGTSDEQLLLPSGCECAILKKKPSRKFSFSFESDES